MGAAKQRLYERLEVFRAVFQNGAYVIGEEITVRLHSAPRWAWAIRSRRESKGFREAAVAIEFRGDPKRVVKEYCDAAAAAVQRKAADDVAVLRVESHVGVAQRNFHLSIILSKGSRSKQQKNP